MKEGESVMRYNALIWWLILLGLAHLGHPLVYFYHVVRHHLLYRHSTCFKDFFQDKNSVTYGPMSSYMGLGRCRVVRVWSDLESYRSRSMSSRTDPNRCRVERVRADLES